MHIVTLLAAIATTAPAAALAQSMPGMDMGRHMDGAPAPTTEPPAIDHAAMSGMDMHGMAGNLGAYAATRDASGTSTWQPDSAPMDAIHHRFGALVGHGPWLCHADLRPAGRTARRRQDVRRLDADGHGATLARRRHADAAGDGQP